MKGAELAQIHNHLEQYHTICSLPPNTGGLISLEGHITLHLGMIKHASENDSALFPEKCSLSTNLIKRFLKETYIHTYRTPRNLNCYTDFMIKCKKGLK